MNKNGDKALHICAEFGKVDIFKWFVADLNPMRRAKVDPLNNAGETPLMIAAREGKMNIVKMYIELLDPKKDFKIDE